MKFLLSFFLWVFGVEAPAEVNVNVQPRIQTVHTIQPSTPDYNNPNVGLKGKDRSKRFGTHIIIFEDTHFRKRRN
ncbi:MAG: hypothetical protein AAF587_40250 [Bacteroidota bacterium]